MTEGTWTKNLLKRIRPTLGPAIVALKHSDRFTTGVPDTSFSNRIGRTVWIEVKHFKEKTQNYASPKSFIDNEVQHYMTVKLGGFYLVRDPFRDQTALLVASKLDPKAESIPGTAIVWLRTEDNKGADQALIRTIGNRLWR